MIAQPAALTAVEARTRLLDGTLSVQTIASDCLGRIVERDAIVMAWSEVDAARVMSEAQRLDGLSPDARGALHGVPIGIKDVLLTRDMPTGYGSALYRGFAPTIDAAAVAVLRSAGALLIGKTHTVEFAAVGAKPPTRNPWNPEHTPGGSSSGSAAAVADGHVPLALGTQTGGSIIRPASFCGTWAIKPTWGLVDRDGAKTFAISLDTVGWFGRSAGDLALLLDIFDPPAVASITPASDNPLRVAFCRTPMWPAAEEATCCAFALVECALRSADASVDMLDLPPCFADLARDHATIMYGEGKRAFLAAYREFDAALNPVFRDMVETGPSRDALLRAYDRASAARAMFDEIADDFDVVIAPSACGDAPHGLGYGGSFVFNGMWTLLHTPCVNIPGLFASSGMPVGLTATGPRFADARVIAAADRVSDAIQRYVSRK